MAKKPNGPVGDQLVLGLEKRYDSSQYFTREDGNFVFLVRQDELSPDLPVGEVLEILPPKSDDATNLIVRLDEKRRAIVKVGNCSGIYKVRQFAVEEAQRRFK